MTREPVCGSCGEPWRPGEPQRFCVTCDVWLHIDCLMRHAAVVEDGEGDYRHRGEPTP